MTDIDHESTVDRASSEALLGLVLNHRGAARTLLDRFGDLRGVAAAPMEAWATEPSVGRQRARRLRAAFALAQRAAIPSERLRIQTAEDAAGVFLPRLAHLRVEEVHVAYADRQGRMLRVATLSRGSEDKTLLDPLEVLRGACEVRARWIFLAHNHPSGDTTPSLEDIRATLNLQTAARQLGLLLCDHLIICGGDWVSLARRGELGCTPR